MVHGKGFGWLAKKGLRLTFMDYQWNDSPDRPACILDLRLDDFAVLYDLGYVEDGERHSARDPDGGFSEVPAWAYPANASAILAVVLPPASCQRNAHLLPNPKRNSFGSRTGFSPRKRLGSKS